MKGIRLSGMELLYNGDVPNGAGLSSSASIEVVTAVAINELFKAGLDRIDLVKMSQKAENEFVGNELWYYGPVCSWFWEKRQCNFPEL